MPKVFVYPAALFLYLLASALHAQESKVLIIGHDDFPPIAYIDEFGNSQGNLLDYAQQVFNQLGYSVKFRPLPSARLFRELINGKVHVWIGAKGKPPLKNHVLESKRPISQITLALYYHPDLEPPVLPASLQNQKIIAIRGFSYWDKVNAWLSDETLNIELVKSASHTSAIAMLLKKRSNFLLSYQEPMLFTKEQLGIDMLSIPSIKLKQIPMGFIISKRHPQAQEILQGIDQLLEAESNVQKTAKEP